MQRFCAERKANDRVQSFHIDFVSCLDECRPLDCCRYNGFDFRMYQALIITRFFADGLNVK